TAFRDIDPFQVARGAKDLAQTPAEFAEEDHNSGNLAKLRGEMRQALVGQGLNSDEADALLNTWQLSYFQAPGLRMFFIVPQEWTNSVLPIQISGTSEIRRAMVGRIELVTPRQRELLKEIATAPVPNLKEVIPATYKLRG